MTDVYGLPNCDTTKKQLKGFKKHAIPVNFHDLKTIHLTKEKISKWAKALGWEKVLNKKSTTWRELATDEQSKVIDDASAVTAMLKHPTLIKRPLIETGDRLTVGYNETYFSNTK